MKTIAKILMIFTLVTFTSMNIAQAQKVKGKGEIVLSEALYGKVSLGVYIWDFDKDLDAYRWLQFDPWAYNMRYDFKMSVTDTLRVKFVDLITFDVLSTFTVYGDDSNAWKYTRTIYVGKDYVFK